MSNASPLTTPEPWNLVSNAYRNELLLRFTPFSEEALRLAAVKPGEHVLDVATGPGTLALLAAKSGARVSAIDFSPAMIQELRSRLSEEKVIVEASVGDGMALPYPDDDLEGGPGTFLLFNEFGQCVLLMCSVSLSLIGMSISITDRDSR